MKVNLEIELKKNIAEEIKKIIDPMNKENDKFFFRKTNLDKIGYMIIKSNSKGKLLFQDKEYTSEYVLNAYLKYCLDNDIEELIIISNFGKYIPELEIKGIKLKVIHHLESISMWIAWKTKEKGKIPYLCIKG